MNGDISDRFSGVLGEYFPSVLKHLESDPDLAHALGDAMNALENGGISWARLNQTLHRSSEAGMSEGFFKYYFLTVPPQHPYPVSRVFAVKPFEPPADANQILSLEQLQWGIRRFIYDAMLYWGNFRQAYRELRQLTWEELRDAFELKRFDEGRLIRRGTVESIVSIPRDHRYLISETACKTYEPAETLEDTDHVKLALSAFRALKSAGHEVTPERLKNETKRIAEGNQQGSLFELMYEEARAPISSEAEVVALYSGQSRAFHDAREKALANTRTYLSACNDLDVYVATSMRIRTDFREMATACDSIFSAPELGKYNLRYFDPTLSAAKFHEDKGLIECLMVKTAKVLLYFSQEKESLGKVSEYAMALSLGKPVIVLCPQSNKGKELYRFYREGHPLTRLVAFATGTVNGAMVTENPDTVVKLLVRIFSNSMEYDLERKAGTDAYYLLKERLTGTTVRVITDDKLLTQTFWNNWHGIA